MTSPDKTTSADQRPVLANIQYLRAVAAYLVVLYHARLLTPLGQAVSLDFGRAGVDIFFVISGFIIQHVATHDDRGHPGTFLLKRAIRIVPLYWMLTLLIGVAGQVAPGLAGDGGVPDLGRIVRSLLFVPYYDDAGAIHPVLFIGWTLNYEVFFYLLFAVGLAIRPLTTRLLLVSAALLGLVVAGFVTAPRSAAGLVYTSPLLLEFGAGVWLHVLWRRCLPLPAGSPYRVVATILLVLAAVALVVSDLIWPAVPEIVKWGIPALLIVAAAVALERPDSARIWRPGLMLGEASYAIYLLHPFVIKIVSLVYARLGVTAMPLHVLALLATLLIVGLVGVGAHLLLERPLIDALRHRLLPRAKPAFPSEPYSGTDRPNS